MTRFEPPQHSDNRKLLWSCAVQALASGARRGWGACSGVGVGRACTVGLASEPLSSCGLGALGVHVLRQPPGAVIFTGVTGPTKYSNTAESRSQNTDKNGRQALCPGRPPIAVPATPQALWPGPWPSPVSSLPPRCTPTAPGPALPSSLPHPDLSLVRWGHPCPHPAKCALY